MNLQELFINCNSNVWITSGIDVQYKVVDGILYFQCSSGESDWRYNFSASEDVYKNSDIEFSGHKGFNLLWESIRHDIELLDFNSICGYSQGGALAVRAHENYFHRFGFEPEVTITFGCPPSIKNPSPLLLSRFTNLVNYHNPRDLVYYVPMLIGYKHVGISNNLNKKANRPENCNLIRWLSGHSPEEYMQRTEK